MKEGHDGEFVEHEVDRELDWTKGVTSGCACCTLAVCWVLFNLGYSLWFGLLGVFQVSFNSKIPPH